jgi:hypothetical protein
VFSAQQSVLPNKILENRSKKYLAMPNRYEETQHLIAEDEDANRYGLNQDLITLTKEGLEDYLSQFEK